jgi:hypothetical protein
VYYYEGLTKQRIPWNWFLFGKLVVAQLLKKSQHFMELEGSLPWSEESTTGSYPEPDESIPHPSSCYLKINFNNIIQSTHRSSWCSLSLRFFYQNIICIPMPGVVLATPSHPPWLDHSNSTSRDVQIMKFLVICVPPLSCYLIPLRCKCFLLRPVLRPSVYVYLLMWEPNFQIHKNNR